MYIKLSVSENVGQILWRIGRDSKASSVGMDVLVLL